jgi:hypothetical protein
VRIRLKSLGDLEYSQNNSELLQTADASPDAGQAVSMACGDIPCAAEQENEFAGTGK